jgi:hypothetical protein
MFHKRNENKTEKEELPPPQPSLAVVVANLHPTEENHCNKPRLQELEWWFCEEQGHSAPKMVGSLLASTKRTCAHSLC